MLQNNPRAPYWGHSLTPKLQPKPWDTHHHRVTTQPDLQFLICAKSYSTCFSKIISQSSLGALFKNDVRFGSTKHPVFGFPRWSIRRTWKVVEVTVSTTVRLPSSGMWARSQNSPVMWVIPEPSVWACFVSWASVSPERRSWWLYPCVLEKHGLPGAWYLECWLSMSSAVSLLVTKWCHNPSIPCLPVCDRVLKAGLCASHLCGTVAAPGAEC